MPFSCTSPFDVRRGVLPFSCKSPFDMRRGGIALLLQISRHATVNRMASGSVGLQSHQGCDRTGESPGGHLVSKASILRENGPDTQETWCQDGDDIYIYIHTYIYMGNSRNGHPCFLKHHDVSYEMICKQLTQPYSSSYLSIFGIAY